VLRTKAHLRRKMRGEDGAPRRNEERPGAKAPCGSLSFRRAKALRLIPKVAALISEVVDAVGSEDQQQGDGGYGYFAYGSYDKGAGSLLEEVFEVGAEAYSGEG